MVQAEEQLRFEVGVTWLISYHMCLAEAEGMQLYKAIQMFVQEHSPPVLQTREAWLRGQELG